MQKSDKSDKKNNVDSSQIFFNIADEDMKDYFLEFVKEEFDREAEISVDDGEPFQQLVFEEKPEEKLQLVEEKKEKEEKNISRLEIQIEKNNLNFIPVYGELFFMLGPSYLIGQKKKSPGKLLITSYRLAFFKKSQKRIDVPFGFISHSKFNDKNLQLLIHLKHALFWRFYLIQNKDYEQLKMFIELYAKPSSPKSSFAFNYALKYPFQPKKNPYSPKQDFTRLMIKENEKFIEVENKQFEICATYPETFFIPSQFSEGKVKSLARSWNLHRLPILCYLYKSIQKIESCIWRSSALIPEKHNLSGIQPKYLRFLHKIDEKLYIFDVDCKQNQKHVEQNEIYEKCVVSHFQIESIDALKLSYEAIVGAFLNPKNEFIKSVLDSKWYEYIIHILQTALKVANQVLMENSVLIRCTNGYDRSPEISALVQIIIDPYYRTMDGFGVLIEKQFNYFSYPFATRLGTNSQNVEQIPIFIQFLDCVSQLIHTNQMSFQFNHKYLSKLSNFMYTSLFGTFICDSRRQIVKYNVQTQTTPIWLELSSQLTKNAFYQQKHGLLQILNSFSEIRLWKEHFWYLTTPSKDSYKIHPLAEDNEDYVNLGCLKVILENDQLKRQISLQRQEIQKLKMEIENKKKKQ